MNAAVISAATTNMTSKGQVLIPKADSAIASA